MATGKATITGVLMTTGEAKVHTCSVQMFDDRILTLRDCRFACWRSDTYCNRWTKQCGIHTQARIVSPMIDQPWKTIHPRSIKQD